MNQVIFPMNSQSSCHRTSFRDGSVLWEPPAYRAVAGFEMFAQHLHGNLRAADRFRSAPNSLDSLRKLIVLLEPFGKSARNDILEQALLLLSLLSSFLGLLLDRRHACSVNWNRKKGKASTANTPGRLSRETFAIGTGCSPLTLPLQETKPPAISCAYVLDCG